MNGYRRRVFTLFIIPWVCTHYQIGHIILIYAYTLWLIRLAHLNAFSPLSAIIVVLMVLPGCVLLHGIRASLLYVIVAW